MGYARGRGQQQRGQQQQRGRQQPPQRGGQARDQAKVDRAAIRKKVFDEVQAERERADPTDDGTHGPWDWLMQLHKHQIMAEVIATRMTEQPPPEERQRLIAYYRTRMVKIASLACAAIEAIDRRKGAR